MYILYIRGALIIGIQYIQRYYTIYNEAAPILLFSPYGCQCIYNWRAAVKAYFSHISSREDFDMGTAGAAANIIDTK